MPAPYYGANIGRSYDDWLLSAWTCTGEANVATAGELHGGAATGGRTLPSNHASEALADEVTLSRALHRVQQWTEGEPPGRGSCTGVRESQMMSSPLLPLADQAHTVGPSCARTRVEAAQRDGSCRCVAAGGTDRDTDRGNPIGVRPPAQMAEGPNLDAPAPRAGTCEQQAAGNGHKPRASAQIPRVPYTIIVQGVEWVA